MLTISPPGGRAAECAVVFEASIHDAAPSSDVDVVVVGAGFAGLYMLHRLRGLGLTSRVFEAGAGVGGTWFWNRYPGARCDAESLDYSYGFDDAIQQEWEWSERFATQPEILRYIEFVADRLDLRRGITFSTRVLAATFADDPARWTVTTDTGETVTARFVVLATGALSAAKTPDIPGLESFAGTLLHTNSWPEDDTAAIRGRRVGVIGTGSSAIQAIPILAEQAAHLHVFQRTPAFSLPARNAPLDPEHVKALKARYGEYRAAARKSAPGVVFRGTGKPAMSVGPEERARAYEEQWARGGVDFQHTFNDAIVDPASNAAAAAFVHGKIAQIVKDPETADSLTPKDYPIGAKRLCLDTDYYATFNRDNVTLVDLRKSPLEAVTPDGVRTSAGVVPLDTLVLATGFDAMTGSMLRIDVRGVDGVTLREKWAAGPTTYLGIGVSGFPNMFVIAGPGSPSVLSNVVLSIEQHVEWISDALAVMAERGETRIEASAEAEAKWVERVNAMAAATLVMQGNSWYLGANVPGKPRVFMPYIGGVGRYRETCDRVAANGYEGFNRQ